MRLLAALAAAAVLAGCANSGTGVVPPKTVKQVDLQRYQGTWYEQARLPMFFQRDCAQSEALYELQGGGATITHDLDSSNGHEPHQELLDSIPWLSGLTQLSDEDDGSTVQAAGPLARDDAKARNEPPL
jgi:hypothetical protein